MKTRARERDIGWRLDYFFVSKDLLPKVLDSFIMNNVKEIIDTYGSDHCPVGLKVQFD